MYECPQPWILDDIVARRSKIHGTGLFTTRRIQTGEIVVQLRGYLFSMDQVRSGLARPESLTGFSEDIYLGSPHLCQRTLDEYLNHSCDPNLWLDDDTTIIARKVIPAGKEITIDYATFEIDENWKLPSLCNCGAEMCRHTVSGHDWTIPALQKRYDGHFLDCISARFSVRDSIHEAQNSSVRASAR